MEDTTFNPTMDSDDEGMTQTHEVFQHSDTEHDVVSVRHSEPQMDDELYDDVGNGVGRMEDVDEGNGAGREISVQDTEEDEEEMDYTSGNEYQESRDETYGEGEMFHSCHEDFNQGRGFIGDHVPEQPQRPGPHSPLGSPPDSQGSIDSGSETAEFDYATPSDNEPSVRLQSKLLEEEGTSENLPEELATPASPVSTTGESSQFDGQESDSFNYDGDYMPSSGVDASELNTDHDDTITSQTHVPYDRQEELEEERRGLSVQIDAAQSIMQEVATIESGDEGDENEEKVGNKEKGQSFDEVSDDVRLLKHSDNEEDGEEKENEGDQSTDVIGQRTETAASETRNELDNVQEMQKERHKDFDDDHFDLTVPNEDVPSKATSRREHERGGAAVVEVHHIDDHGDELDFEEDVEDHAQQYHEAPEEQAEEEKEKKEEQYEEKEQKKEAERKEVVEEPESEGDGEVQDDEDEEKEEGEDGELDDDDMEEGEVKDPAEKKKVDVRPTCRFYARGHCTWGNNCRFIHPGVNDKGHYSLIDRRELHNAQAVLLGQPLAPPSPPPKEALPPPAEEEEELELLPPPPEEQPRTESAWERGLRHARELRKKAMQLKEKGVLPAEQKTIGDVIDEENDFDKENEFFPGQSNIDDHYMEDDMFPAEQYPYPVPPEPYERPYGFREQPQPSPPRQVYRVQPDYNDPRRRMGNQGMQWNDRRQNNFSRGRPPQFNRQRPQQQGHQQQMPFRRGRSPGGGGGGFDKRRIGGGDEAARNLPRRDKLGGGGGVRGGEGPAPGAGPGAGPGVAGRKPPRDRAAAPDAWQDPWARTKDEKGKKGKPSLGSGRRARSRSNSSASYSDRSYSSRSHSRSRSRSYSSRSRSSSRSSYSGSSRSRSRSRSARSQSYSSLSSGSRSRSPPPAKSRAGAPPSVAKGAPKPGGKLPLKPGQASSKPVQQQKSQLPMAARLGPARPPTARPMAAKAPGARPPGPRPQGARPPGARPSAGQPPARRGPPGPTGPQSKGPPGKVLDKQAPVKSKSNFPKPVPMKRRSRSRSRSESLSSISSRSSYSSISRSRSRSISRSRSRSHSGSYSRSSSSSRSRSRSPTRHHRPSGGGPTRPGGGPTKPGAPRPMQTGGRPQGARVGGQRPGVGGPRPGAGGPRPGGGGGIPRPVGRGRPMGAKPGGQAPGGSRGGGAPPPHRSKSFSRSRSRSSSVSSRSSVSSADSENMYANLASPVSSASSSEMAPAPKRGMKGKPDRMTKPPQRTASQPGAASSKKGKPPVGKPASNRSAPVGKAPPMARVASTVKSPVKAAPADRPTGSSGVNKGQGSLRTSSTTAPQPKAKPSRGGEGKAGARPSEQRLKERGPPMPASSANRPGASQQSVLKHAARKEIKLNLITKGADDSRKHPAEPASGTRQEKKSRVAPDRDHKMGSSTVKQQATSSTDARHGPSRVVSSSDRKRPLPTSPGASVGTKAQPPAKAAKSSAGASLSAGATKPLISALKTSAKAAPPAKKESVSRREEILKQLQAVEDLIRKKKAKMK